MSAERFASLETHVSDARRRYEAEGHGADSWQWKDEGLPYAVGGYISSCEMTAADRAYAKANGLEEEVAYWEREYVR